MGAELANPATKAKAYTKSDTTVVATVVGFTPRGIYVGGAGDVAIVPLDATDETGAQRTAVTFSAVPVGTILPVRPYKIMSTNTTATLLVVIG